ncbi:hypothetical protein SRHO_G00107440 [Serrasalmus rhombeus]
MFTSDACSDFSGRQKKAVWMDCGIHAREWIAPAFCQWFVKEILQTYRTDEKMKQMVQNLDFYVTPVLNIDGYIYTWINESMEVGLAAAKAMTAVHGMEYEAGTPPEILYEFSGSSQDWAWLIGIPFSYTFELRDKAEFGFLLPEEQIQPACEEAYAGARHIITTCTTKSSLVAQIQELCQ